LPFLSNGVRHATILLPDSFGHRGDPRRSRRAKRREGHLAFLQPEHCLNNVFADCVRLFLGNAEWLDCDWISQAVAATRDGPSRKPVTLVSRLTVFQRLFNGTLVKDRLG
jgi:hypothetical protein